MNALMRSAGGGQPGRKYSTCTASWTGSTRGSSGGTMPSSLGTPRIGLGVLDIGALEHAFGVAQAELVADGGHVGRHGAIAEGDQHFGPRADFMEDLQVVLVADGAFDQADIHVFGIFLDVHDRAVNQLDFRRRGR